jgi:hypothetical protein
VDFTSWTYSVQNPRAFSMAYLVDMLPFVELHFLHTLLGFHVLLHVGYIHLGCMGPQRLSSSIRCHHIKACWREDFL